MIGGLLKKIFGSRNERLLLRFSSTLATINRLEPELRALSDSQLGEKTTEFRKRLEQGETLDRLLPESFAVVREAARRTLDMRHFDVQLIGGMVLHQGRIAEMRTGEGKTLVATLAAYLNALPGNGVHIVTVNDYLARRDAEWMGDVYRFLNMEVGTIVPDLPPAERRRSYAADITYGTNNEFGFDYLRDNMVRHGDDRTQRELHYAIVDEVDCILIDEARTPLIISGSAEEETELYTEINRLIPKLAAENYALDEKSKQVHLNEAGHTCVEDLLVASGLIGAGQSLYTADNLQLMHYLDACLRSHLLYKRDVDYIVRDNQVIIIDQFTGRPMPGRRWSEGLHQAVEAKEQVPVQTEYHNLATITFQNYFRLYRKLAGMTGTADTEAHEFQQIYGLEVIVIPTHKKMIREDFGDMVFLREREKFEAVTEEIKECRSHNRPTLVGTTSIEVSEHISSLLKKEGIPHQVLNAKHHAQEAEIISQAGKPGSVTIATNMAGRGTDIVLGGNPDIEIKALENPGEAEVEAIQKRWRERYDLVVASGGLHIIGTERHESRRIDNQLRGRSGRQGDPGSSRFYLSLEDNLMRIFASERVSAIMQKLGMQEGEAIEHPWVTKAIENAQRKVEAHNFDLRKHLLEYDDVANEQRKVIYGQRNDIMDAEDLSPIVLDMRADVAAQIVNAHIPPDSPIEMWDMEGLSKALQQQFRITLDIRGWLEEEDSVVPDAIRRQIQGRIEEEYGHRTKDIPTALIKQVEKQILLDVLDRNWRDHLQTLDHLRRGINLRAYAAKNPKQEFKNEAFNMFVDMLDRIKHDTTAFLTHLRFQPPEEQDQLPAAAPPAREDPGRGHQIHAVHQAAPDILHPAQTMPAGGREPYVRRDRKVGRNQPCPCGSGKKFKHCHGQPRAR